MRRVAAVVAGGLAALVAATPAHAAKTCDEPGGAWERATPAKVGMDAEALQDAVDFGSSNLAFAVRVYRHGCLVATDCAVAANANSQYESWSLAKSVTSMTFGRGDARAREPGRPDWRAGRRGRRGARQDHDASPADDGLGPALERLSRLQHHDARPGAAVNRDATAGGVIATVPVVVHPPSR